MSAEIPLALPVDAAHRAAIDEVNRWRGHCMECFARIERAITDTLTIIATVDAATRLPHNFGDRAKALRAALETGSAFANAKLARALENVPELIEQRNLLVHATGSVWIDASGHWMWDYRFLPSGKGKSEISGTFESREAVGVERALAKTSQSLCSQLKAFQQKLIS